MRIEEFNGLPAEQAAALVRACADAPGWVDEVVAGRPYPDVATLVTAAERLAERWTDEEVEQALSHHPRIGERPSGTAGAASAREQAGVDPADAELAEALRAGNRAYEEKFGRIYLVRAKGRSGPELLSLLQKRLTHDPVFEYGVMVGELREIAVLRVKELFAMSTCSTHVLDAARGRPASGVVVTLTDADGNQLDAATTDVGGRARFDPQLAPGVYELTFATGQWFAEQDRETWYPVVTLAFAVAEGESHYHVALLLSPFAYTTYRGS